MENAPALAPVSPSFHYITIRKYSFFFFALMIKSERERFNSKSLFAMLYCGYSFGLNNTSRNFDTHVRIYTNTYFCFKLITSIRFGISLQFTKDMEKETKVAEDTGADMICMAWADTEWADTEWAGMVWVDTEWAGIVVDITQA